MFSEKLGQCCKDMADAIKVPENSLFRIESNGVMYLSIGFSEQKKVMVWFDQAVLFCPFCGKKIQDKDEIAKKASN